MSRRDARGAAAIAGIGVAGLGDATGFTDMEILAQAAQRAVADAGLKMSEIDGLMTASFNRFLPGLSVGEYLGIHPNFVDCTNSGGSSYVSYLASATRALQAGDCSAVLVAYGSTARSAREFREHVALRGRLEALPYEAVYRPFNPPTAYAMAAVRHMYQYGTTREQLAAVAVAARQWAQLNPEAFARSALSIEDVLNSKMVSSPLTVQDCCLVTDGAWAFVVVRADRARSLCATKPVYILGTGAAQTHRQISAMPDLTVTAAKTSGAHAFEMAGLRPSQIDVVQLYDAFTINVILFLEDLGFCPKGEGGRFVEGGRIAPGGALAVNTNGGGLSCVHPGMYGVFTVIEAVRQLRGAAGLRQIEGAMTAICHGNGGVLAHQATAILGNPDTL